MTKSDNRSIDAERLLGVDPERLSRQELIDLVLNLKHLFAEAPEPPAPSPLPSPPARAAVTPGTRPVYAVAFDGGSLGNPGLGYGSYEVSGPGIGTQTGSKLEFGQNMTNNQAEFRALIAGLESLLAILGDDAPSASVVIRGDSQLVIRGLKGEWRIKHAGLQPLYRHANELLRKFDSVNLTWQPRNASVRTFGH